MDEDESDTPNKMKPSLTNSIKSNRSGSMPLLTPKDNSLNQMMLTRLQESAQLEPIMVACTVSPPHKPAYFGEEFHGKLNKEEEKKLLEDKVGRYIVRECFSNACLHEYTLAFNYKGIQHVRLFFNPTTYKFTADLADSSKEYSKVVDLVTDVLELFRTLQYHVSQSNTSIGKKEPYQKPHHFKLYSYKHPKWCYKCKQFLWGLFNQGYKCEHCDVNVHKACRDFAPLPCEKVVIAPRKISLEDKKRSDSLLRVIGGLPVSPSINTANECNYFCQCSRFLSAFNIRDSYAVMDSNLTKCFCVKCIAKHRKNGEHEINDNGYESLNEWARFQLKNKKSDMTKNFKSAYFPIKPLYINSMLSQCYENSNENDNSFDLIVAPSFQNTIEDMEQENWSYKFIDTRSDTDLFAQTVLEIWVSPQACKPVKLSSTADIEVEHWSIQDINSVYPISVWVKIFNDNSSYKLL